MSDSSRLDAPDEALAAALTAPPDGAPDATDLVTLDELADAAELSLPLLEALTREGLLLPSATDPDRYSLADAETVRAGLELVEAGLPLAELLDLARRYDAAMRDVADHAVDLFVRFVRDPVQGTAATEEEAADRLVSAFRTMLPATSRLVADHFRQLLIARARARIEAEMAGPDTDGTEVAEP